VTRAPFIWTPQQPIVPGAAFGQFMGGEPRTDGLNRWFLFRRTVQVDAVPNACTLSITVDGRYKLFVNGQQLSRGPVRCTPFDQKYDVVDIGPSLVCGRNVIGVLIHCFGTDMSWYEMVKGHWQPVFGDGALWVDSALVRSDADWRCIQSDAWDNATPQANHGLDFIENFDARKFATEWLSPAFNDTEWDKARVLEAGGGGPEAFFGGMATRPFPQLVPNPLPPLAEAFVRPNQMVWAHGLIVDDALPIELRAYEEALAPLPPQAILLNDYTTRVTTADHGGVILLYRFDSLHTGYPCFEIDALGGEEIEIAVSEQVPGEWDVGFDFDQARIARKPLLGLDAHVCRYVARPGMQRFERFAWAAVKWMQISIRNAPAGVTLSQIGVVQTHYPVADTGRFASSDPLLDQIWQTGADTLKLCMHDGWEDCPSREQRQWLGDATVEYLVGQVAFGPSVNSLNAKFLCDAAASQRPDGLTQMFAPGNHGRDALLIPDWTLQWALNAHNHLIWSGDLATIEEIFPHIQRALGWFAGLLNDNGLIADMPYWHFMDWSGVGRTGESCTLNALLAGCFDAAAAMAAALAMPRAEVRYRTLASAIKVALNRRHWDGRRGVYVDSVDADTGKQDLRVSQHANAAMILWGDAPLVRWPTMVDRISDPERLTFTAAPPIANSGETLDPEHGVVLANTFFSHFVQSAFVKAGRADLTLALVRRRYGPMLARGATTLWESFEPTASLCHGFSATPTYQLTTGVMGLQPDGLRFASLRIAPQPAGLAQVSTRLATIHGDIDAKFVAGDGIIDLDIVVPASLPFTIVAPDGFAIKQGPANGKGGTHAIRMQRLR
jgi:alpha-L-rhamnosidase